MSANPVSEPALKLRFRPSGPRALLIEVESQRDVLSLYEEIEQRRRAGWRPDVVDVVPGARTVLIDGVADIAGAVTEIRDWALEPRTVREVGTITVPTIYDGPDLAYVARAWQMTTREVVATHTGTDFWVAFNGFAPGFAYLAGLPDELSVPRRSSPRPSVPPGSVGLAGEYSAVYPRSSPGGWQLIGCTDMTLWKDDAQAPGLLTPGMVVRFVEVAPG